MKKFSLLFESPPWLIFVGIVLGIGYAALLYYKRSGPWGKNLNYLLAFLRFALVTQLTLLLFGPLIRQIKNSSEPPTVVLAIDDSESIGQIEDSSQTNGLKERIASLENALSKKGYSVDIRTLDQKNISANNIQFRTKSTDLDAMLKGIQNDYESRNLASVVLMSDGIFSLGMNPTYSHYGFPVNTVGLGDTTKKPDINLNALQFNKIAYQGNKFPIMAEIKSVGMPDKEFTIQVSLKGKVLESKKISVKKRDQFDRVQFLMDAKENGMQRYVVSVVPVKDEFTTSNNTREAYIDIINGKERILVAAPSPHPDIKAIRKAIEKNQNYEVVLYIPGIDQYKEQEYDAIIFDQVPDKRGVLYDLLTKSKNKKIPSWYILGEQTNIGQFNQMNGLVIIQLINNQFDDIFPFYNPDFNTFNYSKENIPVINEYPPVLVPFANFKVSPSADVMLYQKIGNVRTNKPLLLLQNNNGQRTAVMLGEGLWRWRLQEYANHENHDAFDEMISKVIQFLSTKEDKRRFKVYPIKNEFYDNETEVFETEVYNEIYEPTYGHEIELNITDEAGNTKGFTYVTSASNSRYRVSGLEKGIYTYDASTELDGNKLTSSGTFTVKALQLETMNLTADFNLLRNLSVNSGGKFYMPDQMGQLQNNMVSQSLKDRIYSTEDYLAIINLKWAFFILLIFMSMEWFLRKFFGSY